MGQKDYSDKVFEEFADNFADFINAVIYDGREVLKPNDLRPAPTVKQYFDQDQQLKEQLRDVANYYTKDGVIYSIIGIENQTKIDRNMYLRMAGYNGAVYASQYHNRQFIHHPVPVITIVAYFGTEHWHPEADFYEYLNVPKELQRFVDNIRLHVVSMAFLSESERQKFHGDFYHLAKALQQARQGKLYLPAKQQVNHYQAFLIVMVNISGDYVRLIEEDAKKHEGEATMTESQKIIQKWEDKGKAEGKIETIKSMMINLNLSAEEAINIAGVKPEEKQRYLDLLKDNNND